jgi:hypothetical protein
MEHDSGAEAAACRAQAGAGAGADDSATDRSCTGCGDDERGEEEEE